MTIQGDNARVFVYGTLKQGGRFHTTYCGGFDFQVERAQVQGLLFDFPRLAYPGAVEGREGWIRGELINFAQSEQEVLPRLDQLEGYDPDRPPSLNEYYRKWVPVFTLENRKPVGGAWCYFMDISVITRLGGVLLPEGAWTV